MVEKVISLVTGTCVAIKFPNTLSLWDAFSLIQSRRSGTGVSLGTVFFFARQNDPGGCFPSAIRLN